MDALRTRFSVGSRIFAMGATFALLALAWPAGAQFAGKATLSSINSAGVPANGDSGEVATSADGSIIAFASDADNLVPLDENGDTDVFVHDSETGITSRVSVTWQGEEATGDSKCPSISADGRFVAFLSRAWNMRQGATNVGPTVWEVYLHDRQGPSTIRVSEPTHGGEGTAHSSCPVISANGERVAFSSYAGDLGPLDENGRYDVYVYDIPTGEMVRASAPAGDAVNYGNSWDPSLSADGNVVSFSSYASDLIPGQSHGGLHIYVRDLGTGAIDIASRTSEPGPYNFPIAGVCCGQLSADGNLLLFQAYTSNLLSSYYGPPHLYIRDLSAGATEAVETLSMGAGPCGVLDDPLGCDRSGVKAASLSSDGRYVAFLSASNLLLPENPPTVRDQIYIQDRLTRRLRRVTVDPSGYPGFTHPCGGSSGSLALSGDGRVLAFAGVNVEGLGVDGPTGPVGRDVVRLEWTCDPDDDGCRSLSQCPDEPAPTCEPAIRSRLRILRNPPLASRRDRFSWRWVGPPEGEGQDFPDPASGEYHLCVYGGETLSGQIDAGIPAGEPWKQVGKGWRRKDRNGPLEQVRLWNGKGRSVAKISTHAASIDLPYLPIDSRLGITVQLHESTTGRCWESDFQHETISVNRRGELHADGVTPGMVSAVLR